MRATIKASEVIKTQWLAIHGETTTEVTGHSSRCQIPRRNIEARTLQNMNAIEEDRRKIHPFLIGKQAIGNVCHTKVIEPLRPPRCKAFTLFRIAHGDKAKIKNAVLQAGDFIVADGIQRRFRYHLMRRQRNILAIESLKNIVYTRKQNHIGVKIYNAIHVCFSHQFLQSKRLDRGRQFNDIVKENPLAQIADIQVMRRQHPVDRGFS